MPMNVAHATILSILGKKQYALFVVVKKHITYPVLRKNLDSLLQEISSAPIIGRTAVELLDLGAIAKTWPDKVIYLTSQPGRAICWRHPTNWQQEKKHAVPTSDVEEIFRRLPLPYVKEEFEIDFMWKDLMENKMEPPPYVHIRRNVYLVKKKREDADADIGCTNCKADTCSEDCVCRVQSISCSKSCHCSETCTNRPFRKDKKVKVVKTQFCGWGVEAAEPIKKGDFVIEYIGEVIDDALCEQRLWDMKFRGDQNFYMCEIRKDFTIDATFKGNTSRFLNHSCDPNSRQAIEEFL
ncbi:SET domain [Macleaya cordata]|uniref:SET domain n=1 Tax=Macleaya cordata TaxID=56857 RepID=A0A200PN07_MACCD|nr:SET domain [Macleaya cordata]